ncbi:receptor-like tyrosine-protein kinase kin-16 [Folsomia candida]|uniref:Fibroblast growth factor receptor 2 n=1 Tax=Folsomia candida TaxID=158441 RepID=A0A226E742_FOLCA|nr:receptor-like tyrosine-protein kinase kin-16 [Folsomia candida]OXA53415.1 Fibroblast growth factor receptor 2 [Folsomia candida]
MKVPEIILICLLSTLKLVVTQERKDLSFFNWTDTTSPIDNSSWRWAPHCDMVGNDIIPFLSPASYCGRECHAAPTCTHFAWADFNSGTCWIKKGPLNEKPFFKLNNGYFCGYIPDRDPNLGDDFLTWMDTPVGTTGAKVRYAPHCDMVGNDVAILKIAGVNVDTCARECFANKVCTHFVISTTEGGKCWLKRGDVPTPTRTERVWAIAHCGFLLLQSGYGRHEFGAGSRTLNWVEGGDLKNVSYRWAENCDLSGNDIRNFLTKRENCGGECAQHKECTHFAWSTSFGGTCWIKRGSIPNHSIRTDSGYICGYVTFRKGEEQAREKEGGASRNIWIMWVVIGLLALAGVLSLTIFGLRQRSISKLLRGLDREEIDEFFLGRPELLARNTTMTNETVAFLPYDRAYEVDIGDIEYKADPIGSGNFSVVFLGLIKSRQQPVAVKCPLTTTDAVEFKALLLEIKIMLHIGQHENVVTLIGACTESIQQRKVYILLEYAKNGCMESYLRKRRPGCGEGLKSRYTNIDRKPEALIKEGDLIRWSYEIAKGMEFLASKSIVHADLATRNVLLDDKCTAKVSDFGLSRQLYGNTNYIKKTKAQLPWRWLALESLTRMEFSTESDVWSYGVTLWEIFTFAESPYPNHTWGKEFIDMLQSNGRLDKPRDANTAIYGLMKTCWEGDKSNRPSFSTLRGAMEKLLHTG